MSVQDATSFAAIQPTIVARNMFLTATNLHNIPMLRTCLNLTREANGGITLKMPSHPKIDAQSVTVGSDVTPTAATIGSKSLTKSTNRACFEEGANTERANNNQDDLMPKLMQYAGGLLTAAETLMGGLYTGAGIVRDAGAGDLAETDIQYMTEQFDAVNAPDDRRIAVLSPVQCSAVRKIARFTEVDKYGPNTVLMTGEIGQILGWRILRSNLLTSASSQRRNLFYIGAPSMLLDAKQEGYGQTGIGPDGSSASAGDCSISYAFGMIPAPYSSGVTAIQAPYGLVTIDYRMAAAANQIRGDMLVGVLNHKTEWLGELKTGS